MDGFRTVEQLSNKIKLFVAVQSSVTISAPVREINHAVIMRWRRLCHA